MPAVFHSVCNGIQRHYTVHPTTKSAAETSAERYLFCLPALRTPDTFYVSHCVRFSRWHIFVAAFLSQFCLGSLYAWSVYNAYIDDYITGDANAGRAVLAFYIASGCFGVSAAILGPWLERVGPRCAITFATTLFLLGHLGTGLAIAMKSMVGVYLSYGVVAGTGMGLCYCSPIATLQKWFPDLRGTASGFAVCGFGAGPVLWAVAFPFPLQAHQVPLYLSFPAFGLIMSLVLYFCAMVMRNPPSGFIAHGKDMHGINHERVNLLAHGQTIGSADDDRDGSLKSRRPRQDECGHVILFVPEDLASIPVAEDDLNRTPIAEGEPHPHEYYRECDLDDAELFYFQRVKQLSLVQCLFSPDFVFLWCMFLFASIFGLVMLSRLKDTDLRVFSGNATAPTTADVDRAELMVSYNGIFNFAGRLLWPMASDIVIRLGGLNPATGRKLIFGVNLCVQLLVALLLRSALRTKDHVAFQALVWTLTFVYGGGFGTIPCFLCDMFGAFNIGALHGIILTCWSIAGVGGGLGFSSLFDAAKTHHSILNAYETALPMFAIGAGIGLLSLLLVRTNPVDRFAPGYQYSVGRSIWCSFKPKGWQFQHV
ncbi:hypothetical protein SPRG_14698 [Saprolegnia parasitica CBS 223.65]|uniref:Major facilitator superfamily (MFS) profile domain-containing protein n=1 Tax=Saprolegnia parasitica (strain CBS 223.65) TaxID=695850 RepID=A0A067BYB8_SAPPC|nr:hypothetical protein SPRG_14698 [Saprolegnia parasitica CBS 223.65]KDO19306.1 hypothetical protein SPRG_14698 [Saprolegnia parasitica CBS 223.65]|eukprot:XP_012209980.1 hypothetical protein SPRG_14698 [Saprolegnia parasitica CBS 223.65]